MGRLVVSVSILLCLGTTLSVSAQWKCGSAQDILVRARERLGPGLNRSELEDILQRLKTATDMCHTLGDAWYYRSLVEEQLGRDAEYAQGKAREYKSEAQAQGGNPFRLATSAGERISPTVRDKWALVIGVKEFADGRINPLKYTTKDAEEFAALLKNPDYGRFKEDHVQVLMDKKATTQAIKEKLNWLARSAKEDDMVVIYLSSHGSPGEMDTAGVSYVVTYNTDIKNPDSLYATALPMVDIADAVRTRIKAQRAVVLLDTCHSGAAVQGARALTAKDIGVSTNTLNRIRQGVGRVIIASSQANERSWESEDLKHGYFTYYLIEGLKQNNGLVSIEKVYSYLRDQVSRLVSQKQNGASQNPVLSKSEQMAEIIIGVDAGGSELSGTSVPGTTQKQEKVGAKALYYEPAKYLGIHYWIELKGVGPATEDRVLRTGDRIKLHVRSNADGYLSLWMLGSSGRGRVFPATDKSGMRVQANNEYTHPDFIEPPTDKEQLIIFFSRSKADLPVLTGKEADAQMLAQILRPKGEKALVFEQETEKQGDNEVGTYVVNKSQGLVIKEIRLKRHPDGGRQQ